MTLKLQIHPSSIVFFLIWLQNLKICSTLNTIELPEMDYLASNLSPEECFQLYNLLDHRHEKRGETLKYINKRNQQMPCMNLLGTWSTDPEESNYKTLDKVALKLAKIGRKDLATWLDRSSLRRNRESDLSRITGAKELEDEWLPKSTCPAESFGRMRIFWKILFIALIILFLLLFCICCCRFICGKLRCACSRNKFDRSRAKEEEEEYYLCKDQYGTTSFQDCYLNKKEPSSGFKKFVLKLKNYFESHEEKKKERLRCQQFQKLKTKLQKMYIDQQKEVKVNKQEERILNSLTEEERDKLGKMIREMKFLLDSDEERERLLLSGKRQGTFIIDMRNLRGEKKARFHEPNQEIRTIKNWGSRERLSSSLSEDLTILCTAETKKCSGNETSRSNRDKKDFKEPNGNRQKSFSRYYLENETQDSLIKKENPISKNCELDVKTEFVECYTISDSEKNCSSPFSWERSQRKCCIETERESNFSTSEETELSTFRLEVQKFEKSHSLSPIISEDKSGMQSDVESPMKNATIYSMKSASAIELGSRKSKFESKSQSQKERTNNKNTQLNRDYSGYSKNKEIQKNKPNSGRRFYINTSRTSLDSNSSCNFTPCYNRKNAKKSGENFSPFKTSDHGDTESQLDLCETYDELGLLFSQHMKQQARPCYRNYCLLGRHLKQRMHDQRQCRIKKNYFQYYPNGQAPSCSSGNICRDTYDEFYLMKASLKERQQIRQTVYERRKKFLDQPCVSPGRQTFQMFSG